MEPKFFVGVDLSKMTMDFALLHGNKPIRSYKIQNTEDSVRSFLKELKAEYNFKSREIVFCAENMGIYLDHLTKVLTEKNIIVFPESPLQIKKSLGIRRGKNDKLDAIRIVEYAKMNFQKLTPWVPPRECILQLKKLTTIRKRLFKVRKILTNEEKVRYHFLSHEESKEMKLYYKRSIDSVNEDIKALDEKMDSIVFSDQRLSNLVTLITSVPCIGKVIAFQIILSTNEFISIYSSKQFASYCGVAPFEWSSGASVTGKTKVSFYANKDIKANLHLAAMGCLRQKNSEL